MDFFGGRPARTGEAPRVDWGRLAPLRIRARAVAEGIYAGTHRSARKGPGVEFGGQRPYTPGDDLRFVDRRALLRHDRMMIRQFETETDRAVWLCVDATASMGYRSPAAPGAKLAFAALVAAALARIAVVTGDPVGLVFLGGEGGRPIPPASGREAFERIVGALESVSAAGDATADERAVERALAPIGRRARRGAVIVLLSDLLDLSPGAMSAFAALGTRGRALIAVQTLDPAERDLTFSGNVRLRALEGDLVVETDADAVRDEYRARLAAIADRWSRELLGRGGRLLQQSTADDPTESVRRVVQAIAQARQ